MADWMEREKLENAKRYNRGFNAGYDAGIKVGIKQEEAFEIDKEEQAKIDPYKDICTG